MIDTLIKTLGEYNSTVNSTTDLIVNSLKPLAHVIIGTFFLIEMMGWSKYLKQEGARPTFGVWLELSYKYFVASFLVVNSTLIFSAIEQLVILIMGLISKSVSSTSSTVEIDTGAVKGWMEKGVVNIVAAITQGVGEFSTSIIAFMRAMQMYLLKCLAPIIIALWISETTKPISINFIKMFSAAALQGALIIIVISLYPPLVQNDIGKVAMSGKFESWATAVASIGKGIVYIIMLFGSQELAKRVIQAS